MSEIRIRRTDRYKIDVYPSPIPAEDLEQIQPNDISIAPTKDFYHNKQKKKGMHWFFAWLLAAFFIAVINTSINYMSESLSSWLIVNFNASTQAIVNFYYFSPLIIWFLSRMLWIRLSYKRYSYHIAWRIITLIGLVLSPLTYDSGFHSDMLASGIDSNIIDYYVTASHLAIGYLIALIPLTYLFFKFSKKEF
ncbi:MAG: hypothetical protein JW811_07875 [Clostridiales bacterium]|nr:hypothetical protein [Clostridiales bacterium]